MKKIDQFTNQYPLMKTLQFSLLPVGETQAFLDERILVQSDEERYEKAKKVKEYIDRYHKVFIETVLSSLQLTNVEKYARLYFEDEKDEKVYKNMDTCEADLHKEIANAFEGHGNFDKLFGKEMITEILPSILTDKEELAIVSSFNSFTTYFLDFHKNRKNLYSDKTAFCSVAYRCVNDNLPKFLDNVKMFTLAKAALDENDLQQLTNDMSALTGCPVEDVFEVNYFNRVLAQSGIEIYNTVIGGYSCEDGSKTKGINEYINHYNQTLAKGEKKLPLLKPLFKQILSERESLSFVAEKFSTDEDVFTAINSFYNPEDIEGMPLTDALNGLKKIFAEFHNYNPCGLFVDGKSIAEVSNNAFGSWGAVQNAWNKEYDESIDEKKKKNTEKHFEQRRKAFKNIKSFSIDAIQTLVDKENPTCTRLTNYFTSGVLAAISEINIAYRYVEPLAEKCAASDKKLFNDYGSITHIMRFLDAVKDLEHLVKPLLGMGNEEDRDAEFYNEFMPLFEKLSTVDRLYVRVRNYVTQKPYSKDKFKLTFGSGNFLSGWAQDFSTRSAHILRRGEEYFLMIVDKKLETDEVDTLYCGESDDEATLYSYHFLRADKKMLPKMFIWSKKGRFAPAVEKHNLPIEDILEIHEKGLYTAEYAKVDPIVQKESLIKLIDYYKLGFTKHESCTKFSPQWKPSEEYKNFSEFTNDAERACYKISEETVNFSAILELVKTGRVYLFRFNNRDFSPFSKGTPNLHTLYFKALFDSHNANGSVFKLNGDAEMFFRKASINKKDAVVHPKNYRIANKNPDNEKKASVFPYDIVKDKRYTYDQFSIHIPITLNFGVDDSEKYINKKVREVIHSADETYVIGIDRGERHLIYISVIDSKGRVVEQRSFNSIGNTNYQKLLDTREKERQKARQDCMEIGNIKDLKTGYVSQVVSYVCELVDKYDAVIALEDLNSSFKNSRKKIEKEVYAKFEKMLIDKLNYLVFKKREKNELGGIANAYQLTSEYKSDREMRGQNGIIFFVPAWATSRTDPSTGFVDLFRLRYTSVKDAKNFFGLFNSIRYIKEENLFAFSFNYSSFALNITDYTDSWTVYSHGDRVSAYKDTKRNDKWTCEIINLTEAFKELFSDFDIDYTSDLKQAIYERTEKEFFERLITLFSLTIQVRNSFAGNPDADYVISPCKDSSGNFYDSRNYMGDPTATLPISADANDAYNIARKGLWAVSVLKEISEEQTAKVKLLISNKDWLRYAQSGQI